MHLRNAVEDAVRRWDALEKSRGKAPVIDFDCAPPADKPRPFENRFAALDELSRLVSDINKKHPALTAQLDAHIAYLRALIGEQLPVDQYILMTQGCVPRGWSLDYIEHRAQMAKDMLESLGISWNDGRSTVAIGDNAMSNGTASSSRRIRYVCLKSNQRLSN